MHIDILLQWLDAMSVESRLARQQMADEAWAGRDELRKSIQAIQGKAAGEEGQSIEAPHEECVFGEEISERPNEVVQRQSTSIRQLRQDS